MAGNVTVVVSLDQSLVTTGKTVQGLVTVLNQGTGAPITITAIALSCSPPTSPMNMPSGLNFGGGGGGAGATVPTTIPYMVNSGSSLSFPFQFTVQAGATVQTVGTVVATVTLSDGTNNVGTATVTAYPPAMATAGSGAAPVPPFMQSPGAALFASNLNSSLVPILLDAGH